MDAVLLTSVALQGPHWIFGLPCELTLAPAKKGGWRMGRMENIWGDDKRLWLAV
jgi:hypothetical protein